MKLRQLQYICAVARCGLNVTAAADSLYTSQPGVSKQIRLLEDELGVRIFNRSGKHLSSITPAGRAILACAERILAEVGNISGLAADFRDPTRGSLSIATTHTQARYVLPEVVRRFRLRYPNVAVHIHQGSPTQIAELTVRGSADIAIATESLELFDDLALLPCYRWNRSVLVPPGHPLLDVDPLTLEAIAEHPIVTYVFGFTGRSQINRAFEKRNLHPQVVLTATDTDVIKTYVRIGLGIGVIATMAYEPERDPPLMALDASHLFEPAITSIAFRRDAELRRFVTDFIELFSPHLDVDIVRAAQAAQDPDLRLKLFRDNLPQEDYFPHLAPGT